MSTGQPIARLRPTPVFVSSPIVRITSNVRWSLLFLIVLCSLHLNVFASSMSLQIRSFNESSVLFDISVQELVVPAYVSLHGRVVGASVFVPLQCSPSVNSISSNQFFLICSVPAFINFEVVASYDLPTPGHYQSPMILASTGFPVTMINAPRAVETNDSSVLLQWSPVLDFPSPSLYFIFSQRGGFPFVRTSVPLGRLSEWIHGFSLADQANFIIMGCNRYSSGLLPDALSCVNSSVVSVILTPPPPSPKISVQPLPSCRLLVSLLPLGGVQVTEYTVNFTVDGILVFQVNTSRQNFTTPALKCAESVLIEAAARNLHSTGLSSASFVSAYTQTVVPTPRSLICRVAADSVTFSWLKPHPYSDSWRYYIRCFINGVPGCPADTKCVSLGVDAICDDDGSIILESEFYTVSHLQLSSNVTIFVQSIDALGFHSNESISATGLTQHSLSDVYAPVITSASLINAHCALIQWSSVRPTNPSWSYLKMSAAAYSKAELLVASVSFLLSESTVSLCSIPSGTTISLRIILNTSIGHQVSSPVILTTPATLPELRPVVLLTQWVSWQSASLCIGTPDLSSSVVISSFYLSCNNYFVASLDPSLEKAIDVAFLFDVSNFTVRQLSSSMVNYSCFTTSWPIYVRPDYCSISVINANASTMPPSISTVVKWQPAANFSVSFDAKIVGVTTSCVVFDTSSRGKTLQDSIMYVQASQSSNMTNVHQIPPFLLSNSVMIVNVCPTQFGMLLSSPLYFRVYFINFNIRSEMIQLSTDSPLVKNPVFPRPYPPSPMDLHLQYLDDTFVYVLRWSLPDSNSDLDGFQIMFANASTPKMSSFSSLLPRTQNFFVLKELIKGTRYYFQVHSVSKYHYPFLNPAGSQVVSLSLDSIPDSVSNLIISSYLDDTIIISWKTVSYPRASAFNLSCNSSDLNQNPTSLIVSSTMASVRVNPFSSGICTVFACADMLCSRKSQPSYIDYNVTSAPVPVTGLTVTNVFESSISIAWLASMYAYEYMICGTLSINIVQQCKCDAANFLNCAVCLESFSVFSPIIVPISQNSFNISGLTPNVELFLFIFARSARGARWIGNMSSIVSARPVFPPQSPPLHLTLVNISSDYAFVKWDHPQSPGAPTEYRLTVVEYGPASNTSIVYVTPSQRIVSVIFKLNNLRLGFQYAVTVKGRNSNGAAYNTPPSNEAAINISLVQPCFPPVRLNVANVTSSSAFVEWDILADGPEVLQILAFHRIYDVKMVMQPVLSSNELPKNQRSHNFTGLTPQQTYMFSVATIGYNADYTSSTSTVIAQAQMPFAGPPLNLSLLFANETLFDMAWNAPFLLAQPNHMVSHPAISYEVYMCYNACMTAAEFPQTARPNDEFVNSFGDLFRWKGLEWAQVLPPVNSYSFAAALNSSTRSFSLNIYNVSSLFVRVCAVNLNKQAAPSNANCAYLRNVRVQGLAPTPLLVAGTNPTISTISLNWVVSCPQSQNDCLVGAFFVIQYSVHGSNIWTDYTESSTISSITIRHLHPGSTYIFRVSSANNAGMSPWSEPSQPSAASTTRNTPTNIRVFGISMLSGQASTSVAVDLYWDALPNIASHLFKVEYQVPGFTDWRLAVLATNGSRFSAVVPDIRRFDLNGSALSTNVSNPFAPYVFRVTGGTYRYGIDPVELSSSVSVILPAAPLVPPSLVSLVLTSNSNSSGSFTIAAPPLSQSMLGLSSQLFFRAFISSNQFASDFDGVGDTRAVFLNRWSYPVYSTSTVFQIFGLALNVTYVLRAQTITANTSVVSTFSTLRFQLAPVPGPPINISVTMVSLNSVSVSWSHPAGAISGYLLEYSVNSSAFLSAGEVGLSNEGTIRNLPPHNIVLIAVSARSLHQDGYGARAFVSAYPTLSCDAEKSLELVWANTSHVRLVWSQGNPFCVRLQQFQVLSEFGWINVGGSLHLNGNSLIVQCFDTKSTQIRRLAFSYNPQDLGTVSPVLNFTCTQPPRPVYNLAVLKTYNSSFLLQFDYDIDFNGMSYFRVDTHCPVVVFRSSVLHRIQSRLIHGRISFIVSQIPNATPCQTIVYHGNSHSSGIENTGTSTPFFSLEPSIDWFPENVSLVGYELLSEYHADVTLSYVLKTPQKVYFVGVFLVAEDAILIYEESVEAALQQITAPKISVGLRSCFAVLCRNLDSRGYATRLNISKEQVICVAPKNSSPVINVKVMSTSIDPFPSVKLSFTVTSAAKFVRFQLFKTQVDRSPFYVVDRAWAFNNSNSQVVLLDTVSSPIDVNLQFNLSGAFVGDDLVYMCIQSWNFDASAASSCSRRKLYFTPVNPNAFLSAHVAIESDGRIQLRIQLSPGHSATVVAIMIFPCSMNAETASHDLNFYTTNFSLPYCSEICQLLFWIPPLFQKSCYELHSRLYNRDADMITKYSTCNQESACKSVIFSVPANQLATIHSVHLTRVFLNSTIKIKVMLTSAIDGKLCIRTSTMFTSSGTKSCNTAVVTTSAAIEYDLMYHSPQNGSSQSHQIELFDELENMLAVETLNVSIPSAPLNAPSFVVSSFFNDALNASVLLNVKSMNDSFPIRFHVVIWPVEISFCGGLLKFSLAPCIGSQSLMASTSLININTLTPSRRYCISLRYANAAGWSPWSDDDCNLITSSRPFLRAAMISSSDSTSTLFVGAKVFSANMNMRLSAVHFSEDINAISDGISTTGTQAQWVFRRDDPERSFFLGLFIDPRELSINFTAIGFITVKRPKLFLPFLLNIQVVDESGNFSLQSVNLAFCQSVFPPVSLSIHILNGFEIDLRFGLSPSDASDVIGYQIMCSWSDAYVVSSCNCSKCAPSTLLVHPSLAEFQMVTLRLSYDAAEKPAVFVRTLGFSGHSEFVPVVSVEHVPSPIKACPDFGVETQLHSAFLDQDTGNIMVQLPLALIDHTVNVEISFSAASGWIPVNSILKGQFIVLRSEFSHQLIFVRLKFVGSPLCVFFTNSVSVEILPPRIFLFPEYHVDLLPSLVNLFWSFVESPCSPFVEVAYAQPCPQVWTKFEGVVLQKGVFDVGNVVSLSLLTNVLTTALTGSVMTTNDVHIVNSTGCRNWFALRAVCSEFPLSIDIHKRLPLNGVSGQLNSTLTCDIESYSNSVITSKISGGFEFNVADVETYWTVISDAGDSSGPEILTIISVVVHENGNVLLQVQHSYPDMAFVRLQIICKRFNVTFVGQVTAHLMPPPLSPVVSWAFVSPVILRVSWVSDLQSQVILYRVRVNADDDMSFVREFFTNSSFVDVADVSLNVSYRIFSSARNRHSAGFVSQSETIATFGLTLPQPTCLSVAQYSAGGVVLSWCTPVHSQVLSAAISVSFQSQCEVVSVNPNIFVDGSRPMAILYGLSERVYNISLSFVTQDQQKSAPTRLAIHPRSTVCKCQVNVSLDYAHIYAYPCHDLFVKSVKLRLDSGLASSEISVPISSSSLTSILEARLSPGLYVMACVSEYYSGAVISGPSVTLKLPLAPIDELKVVFANSTIVSLAWRSPTLGATFHVAMKDRTSNQFNNFTTANSSANFQVIIGRIYDAWVVAVLANSSSDSKTIVFSAVDASHLVAPNLHLTGVYDTFVSISWSSLTFLYNVADGMLRYELSFAAISDLGVVLPFSSGSNLSNPSQFANITLPIQLQSYAIRLSVCICGMDICRSQSNCSSGLRSNESGCLIAMTSPRPPPPTRISMGLFSRSNRDSSMIQVPVMWMPSSALTVLLYRIVLSCDPCPSGSIIQSTGFSLSNAAKAVLLNVTTNSTNFLLDFIPHFSGLLMRLQLSALGVNSFGFGSSTVFEFKPALSCSDLPVCLPNLVTIASSNTSSISLLLTSSPCGSNFDIEAAINGGGFYPVAPITSAILSPLMTVTLIGGTPYFAPSDFVVFRYTVRAIVGLSCIAPSHFNTSSIIFSRSLNVSQYLQNPIYSQLQVISVKSDSAVISVAGASIKNGGVSRLVLILRDGNGSFVASSAIQPDDLVQFSNLPPSELLYLECCSVPIDSRSSACMASSAKPIPVYLHDRLSSPNVTILNSVAGLLVNLGIETCTTLANSLLVLGIFNGTVVMNLSFPNVCPMTILPIPFPFCGTWTLNLQWISAAGPGNIASQILNVFDYLMPPESLFADVIIGPFEHPTVRVSWRPPNSDSCANGQNDLQITGYEITCTVNGTASSVRASSASRFVVLPLSINAHAGMSIIVSVQFVLTRDDLTVLLSRPALANATFFACDALAVEVIADSLQPPLAPCNFQTAITAYSGPISFASGIFVPLKRKPTSIVAEMRSNILNVTVASCVVGTCALLLLPEPGPVGALSSLCIRAASEGASVSWCMKVQFKLPQPNLVSSLQSPIFTGLFCDVNVDVSVVGHYRLPEPTLFLSNVTKSSKLQNVVNSSSATLIEGIRVQYANRQRATVSWNAQLGQQGFFYTLCFSARYLSPSVGVFFATSHLCVTISARPCSACLSSSISMDAVASLWKTNWIATWISTPPSILANNSIVALGPTIVAERNDSGDGIFFANRMGCTISDIMLWNPHAVSGTGQLQITTGENICVIWKT